MSAYGCLLGGAVGEAVFSSVSKIGLCSWGPGQALCPQAGAIVCAPSVPCHCSLWKASFLSFSLQSYMSGLASPLRTASPVIGQRKKGRDQSQHRWIFTSLGLPHCEVRVGLFSPFFLLSCLCDGTLQCLLPASSSQGWLSIQGSFH